MGGNECHAEQPLSELNYLHILIRIRGLQDVPLYPNIFCHYNCYSISAPCLFPYSDIQAMFDNDINTILRETENTLVTF